MSAPSRRWRRYLTGLVGAVAGLLVLALAASAVVSRPAVRSRLAREIAGRATAALGQPVRVGDAELSFVPLRLTLRAIEVGPAERPVARIGTAGVTVRNLRLADREIVLDQVFADGVHVDLVVPPDRPAAAPAKPWVRVVVAHLEVRDVTVERLELPSGAAVEASDAEASLSAAGDGTVRAAVARVGRFTVRVPGAPVISGTISARGRQTPDGWEVGRLRAAGDWWSVVAALRSARGGAVRAEGDVDADLARLDAALGLGAGIGGAVHVTATADVAGKDVALSASFSSPAISAAAFTVTDAAGTVALAGGRLTAALERGTFAGGAIGGSYELAALAEPWRHHVTVHTSGTRLAAFLAILGVDGAGLAARCDASGELGWDGTAIGAGRGRTSVALAPDAGDVPAAGSLSVTLDADDRLHLATAGASLAGAPFALSGTLTLGDWVPDWRLHAELLPRAVIARMLRGWVGDEVLPAELHAGITGDLRLYGPFTDLSIDGRVESAPIAYGTIAADRGEATFALAAGALTVEAATLHLGGGHVDISGSLTLADGSLDLDATGGDLALARLLALCGATVPAEGTVQLATSIRGTLAAPRAEVRLRAAGVTVAGVTLGDGSATIEADAAAVRLYGLAVGPLAAEASIDLAAATARLDATLAGLDLTPLSPALAGLLGGPLDAALHGSFPLAAPAADVTVSTAAGLKGFLHYGDGGARGQVERPDIFHADFDLAPGGRGLAGTVAAAVPSLRRLAAALSGREPPLDGSLAVAARVSSDPGGGLRVDGTIERAAVEAESERVELTAPARFVWADGAVSLDEATLAGPRSRLLIGFEQRADGTLAARLQGALPAALLAAVWPESRPRGSVEVDVRLTGTAADPRLAGHLRVDDGSLTLPGLWTPLTGINGTIALNGSAAVLDGLRFELADGEGSCSGRVVLAPAFELDLGVHVERVPWKLLPRFRPVLSGDLRVTGPLERLFVGADLNVDEASFRGQLDVDAMVLESVFSRERAVERSATPITLNVVVHIPGTLDIDTLQLRLQGRGELRVVGTSDAIGLVGRVEALPGAEAELSGQTYEIDRAAVTFSQPDRIEPAFDLVARAWVDGVEVTVAIAGTPARMTPTFTANPPMSQTDILSLLSSGSRSTEGQPESVSAAASEFLSGQLAGAVSTRARNLLSVDQLRIDPAAATESGDAATRMTVVKQLSPTWTVSVSSNLSSNREEVVHSIWRVGQGMLVDAARQSDGSYSLGFKWQRRY